MNIDYTVAKNFRNLGPELRIKWEPGINLILGANGSGKTNLLESLSILTGWGVFPRSRNANLINWESDTLNAFTAAKVSGEETFEVTANITTRISLKLNDKVISYTDLRRSIPSIIFLTGSTNLIDGAPAYRRLFIDRLCSLFVPAYAKKLADFKQVQQSRTALLKKGRPPEVTSELFCQLGGFIMDKRRQVVSHFKSLVSDSGGKYNFEMLPAIKIPGEDYLHEALRHYASREAHALHPLCGPNFDDLAVTLSENNKPASEALSRGQKRRLILYMIITAGKLTAMILKREPVLLFDDLTAELDSDGRRWTYQALVKTNWQVFITAPEKPFDTARNFGGIDFSVS
ncbi:MAG: AAA family ATPase [Synergistaceae bacterium]|nr:AAA family ATPase [Synergistaceae bacterium]